MNRECVIDDTDNDDYAASQCPRHIWPSTNAFLSASTLADGVHSIDCGGLPLDLLFYGNPVSSPGRAVIPVFFSDAVTTRKGKRPPFFSGFNIAPALGLPIIRIADPSLALGPEIALAWYAGNAMQPVQAELATVLEGIAARSGSELLLIGGSAGGFAALYYGYRLGARASVLVWNPQTDWLEYEETAVRHYLSRAFPDVTLPSAHGAVFRQAAAAAMLSLGVVHSLLPVVKAAASVPRRVVYLQNASDWHVMRHAAPFMDAVGSFDAGDGFHMSASPEGVLWFGNWGKGHEAAPRDLIKFALQRLLDPGMRPAAVAAEVREGEMAVYVDPVGAPRDMRRAVFSTRLEATTTGETLCARVRLEPALEAQAQFTYAFYVYSGQERIAIRWYEHEPSYVHTEVPGKPVTKVLAFVRDGFGRQLSTQETSTIGQAAAKPLLRAAPSPGNRVHIYGSCVSRDAFEFVEHDFVITGYIARSSLASAFDVRRPPPEVLARIGNIESPFQRRMVECDLSRSAAALLHDTPSDAVLVDLIDERFALLNIDGALATRSVEFSRTGWPAHPEQVIPSGSDRHLAAWKQGLDVLLSVVDAKRVIVNRVHWAIRDSEGELLAEQEWIARNNKTLAAMYEHLDAVSGIRFIDYPYELLIADRNHKWGISPFHYAREMYEHMLSTLREMLANGATKD